MKVYAYVIPIEEEACLNSTQNYVFRKSTPITSFIFLSHSYLYLLPSFSDFFFLSMLPLHLSPFLS